MRTADENSIVRVGGKFDLYVHLCCVIIIFYLSQIRIPIIILIIIQDPNMIVLEKKLGYMSTLIMEI